MLFLTIFVHFLYISMFFLVLEILTFSTKKIKRFQLFAQMMSDKNLGINIDPQDPILSISGTFGAI